MTGPQGREREEPVSVAEALDDGPAPPVGLRGASGRVATLGHGGDVGGVGARGVGGSATVDETKGRFGHGNSRVQGG